MDREQRKAFQIITSTFVLTYYDDAVASPNHSGTRTSQIRQDYKCERDKLQRMSRKKGKRPLRMFLDGAGGAGKSRVIKEVLKYAREYTGLLSVQFDSRTIVVTALSGLQQCQLEARLCTQLLF